MFKIKMERSGVQFREPSKIHQDVINAYMNRGLTEIGGGIKPIAREMGGSISIMATF